MEFKATSRLSLDIGNFIDGETTFPQKKQNCHRRIVSTNNLKTMKKKKTVLPWM